MNPQERFWLVVAIIVAGSYGWGRLTLRTLDRGRPSDGRLGEEATPPFVVVTGLAMFLAIGGFAVAAGIAYFPVLAGWFGIGVILALRPSISVVGRAVKTRLTPHTLYWIAGVVIIGGIVVALAYGAAIDSPTNPNDDAAAYLYLAERLLHTGGMVDPFSFRRITSYNSGELLESLFVRAAGPSAGLAVEWFLFGLLTAALFVGRLGRRFALPALLCAGVVVTVVHPVGATVNIAPTFSGVALTFALLQLLAVPANDLSVRRFVLAGLFVAALLSLRYAFAIPACVVVAVVPMLQIGPRQAISRIAAATATAIAMVSGWSIALQISSGTPLYPLVAGNAEDTAQWRNPAVHGLVGYLEHARGEIVTDGWGLEMLVTLVVACVLLRTARQRDGERSPNPGVAVLTSAVLGCALLLGVTTFALSGGSFSGIGRYNAPSAVAALLFAADLAWRDAEVHVRIRARAPAHIAVLFSLVAIPVGATPAPGALPASKPLARLVTSARTDLADAGGILAGEQGFADPWSRDVARYQKISDDIPAGSRVLAAVDIPGLLDFSRFQFATLDIVGAASPSPHLPLQGGAPAVVAYLEALGYSGIVASDTDAVGLYNFAQWKADETTTIWNNRIMANSFVAWSKTLTELSHDRALHVSRAPTLVYFAFPGRGHGSPASAT